MNTLQIAVTTLFSLTSLKALELEEPLSEVGFNPCPGLSVLLLRAGSQGTARAVLSNMLQPRADAAADLKLFVTAGDLWIMPQLAFRTFVHK